MKPRQRSRASSDGSHSDVSLSEHISSSLPSKEAQLAGNQSVFSRETTPTSNSQSPAGKEATPLSSSQPAVSKMGTVAEQRISENAATAADKPVSNGQNVAPEDADGADDFKDAIDSRIPTFFSVMPVR